MPIREVAKIDISEGKPRTDDVKFVPIEEMQNRIVFVMCFIKPAKMNGIVSECMPMCASTPMKIECIIPPAS